jgi:hypothetical protein
MATIRAQYDPYNQNFTFGSAQSSGLHDGDAYMDFNLRELDSFLSFDSEDELSDDEFDYENDIIFIR